MADVASAIVKRSTRGRLAYEDGHKRRHRRSLLALRRCQRISQMRPALLRYCSPLQCLALAMIASTLALVLLSLALLYAAIVGIQRRWQPPQVHRRAAGAPSAAATPASAPGTDNAAAAASTAAIASEAV